MATYPSILAWRIPWTEEPGGLQSMVSQSQTQLKQLSMHACVSSRNRWLHFLHELRASIHSLSLADKRKLELETGKLNSFASIVKNKHLLN